MGEREAKREASCMMGTPESEKRGKEEKKSGRSVMGSVASRYSSAVQKG
jgi:hypothetical protein